MPTHDLLDRERRILYERVQALLTGRLFRFAVLLCIAASIGAVIAVSFESMRPYRHMLLGINYFSSGVFLAEYLLRIFAAPVRREGTSPLRARLGYLFSFYGAVDFVAVLPFLLVYLLKDSPSLHVVTLAYIFTTFKLIRHLESFRLIGRALAAARNELISAFTACGIVICFSAILMYYIERGAQPEAFANVGDGLWWSIVTFTTVGYGDIYPVTPLGRLLGSVISLVGIAMIAIPTGIISSSFITQMQQKQKNRP